jgi:hypothetical protein
MGSLPSTPAERSDVCIVGAGITGLNALFVARRYLSSEARIILVDRRQRAGGMWLDTYDYVRLHQPHPFFTAGNIEWTLGKEREHLAGKDEVLEHLQHCLEVIKQDIQLTELFGYELEDTEEAGGTVRITCRSHDGRVIDIEADRLIKAYGQRIEANEPLELSSERVRSVSPEQLDVRGAEMRASGAPVWVVGGGKTGMDTAHALITGQPGREVNLLAGPGTFFINRDRAFPRGLRRWWAGEPISGVLTQLARRFDGTNETEVMDWYRSEHGTWLTPESGNFLAAFLSEAENETITSGLNDVVTDYLVDVADRNGSSEVILRSGATKPCEPGSWVVNCTGSLLRGEHPYEPYTSPSGRVLSIQNRSSTLPFPLGGTAAYFLTHLMFLDRLAQVPLYEADAEELRRKASPYVMASALLSLHLYNLSLVADAVPARVFTQNGLDIDRWYPLPRRLLASARFMLTHQRDRRHHKRTLDTVAERFGVRCGPVVHASPDGRPAPGRPLVVPDAQQNGVGGERGRARPASAPAGRMGADE